MLLEIKDTTTIKPNVIRFSFKLVHNDLVRGNYDIAEDITRFLGVDESNGETTFDVPAFQRHMTDTIAKLQNTSVIAQQLRSMYWTLKTENGENDNTDHTNAESSE